MLIKNAKAPVQDIKVLPATRPPETEPSEAGDPEMSDADQARAALWPLPARAAWFSALAYHDHVGLTELCAEKKLEQFKCIEAANTTAFAFLFEGRAWLVFRGTNDLDDAICDFLCLPTCHFGFKLCFREISKAVDAWVEDFSEQGYGFCIAGHSLGGALATLAAERIAKRGKPVEILCTFGCPRVFPPWRATAFDDASANPRDDSDLRLKHVTFRFVDRYELVSRVPPAWLGFKHVGEPEECGALVLQNRSGHAAEADAVREDLVAAYRKTMEFPVIGPWLAAAFVAGKAIWRGLKASNAHKMALYAKSLDPMGVFKIAPDAPDSRLAGFIKLALLLMLPMLLAFILYLLWPMLRQVPWETVLVGTAIAVGGLVWHYLAIREQRRRARSWPPGKYSDFLRPK